MSPHCRAHCSSWLHPECASSCFLPFQKYDTPFKKSHRICAFYRRRHLYGLCVLAYTTVSR
jgi:hypothetical protein